MGSHGVRLGVQSEVTNLRLGSNRLRGISTSDGSTVSANTAYQNGSSGISVGSGSIISGNTAYRNGYDGMSADDGSTVPGNTACDNGGDGIETLSGATVWGNTAWGNTDFGLRLGGQSGYRESVIMGNTAGTVLGGVNAGDNVCNDLLTCP